MLPSSSSLSALFSDPGTLAILGLGSALIGALLTAIIQPLWSNFIAPKSRLHVRITPHLFKLPNFLIDGISDYRFNYKLNIKPTEEAKEKLSDISHARGHFSVVIENKSKSSIKGLTIKLSDGSKFFSDIQGIECPTSFARSLDLGTLHPESTIKVHIWTSSDVSQSQWQGAQELITVRAESYDKILTAVETAGYVRRSYFLLSKKPVSRALFATWLLIMLVASSGLISRLYTEPVDQVEQQTPAND